MINTSCGVTGIIPFTYFGGVQRLVGSTYLRVHSLVSESSDFHYWEHGRKYDNLIFQKAYWTEMMELFQGPKILDLCDPDWINDHIDLVAVSELVHAITCSSPELTKSVQKMLPKKPVYHVADRLRLGVYPEPRGRHINTAKKVVWFGFIHNAHETLPQLLSAIQTHQLQLTIVADKPYAVEDGIWQLKPAFVKYDQKLVYEYIKEADMVLNPKSDKAFYKYKSNNKSLIGWHLGTPVAQTAEDVNRLMNARERNREVVEKQKIIREEYPIHKSATEYREIIKSIKANISISR